MFIYQMWWQGRKRRIHYTQSSRKWIFIPTLLFFFVTTTANTCIKMAYLSIEFEYVSEFRNIRIMGDRRKGLFLFHNHYKKNE